MKRRKKINLILLTSLLFTSLIITGINCLYPSPKVIEPPLSIKPTSNYTSGIPIDPAWTPPPQKSESVQPTLSIPEIVKKVSPSVVAIQTEVIAYDIFLQPIPRQGAGTGIIIDSQGYIVTNNHVVEGAKNIKVTLNDGRQFNAIKVNRDPYTDLAVIQIEATGLPKAELGRSEDLVVGEGVVAIGNALALPGGPTVTSGIISYLGRSIRVPTGIVLYDLIQTDAAINPGNSGGPLVNMSGQVIGINTAIIAEAQNIGFAINITSALPVIEQLIRKGSVAHPYLGVIVRDSPTGEGVIIDYVELDSPADKAGLRRGDIIIRFAGENVTTAQQLVKLIRSQEVGKKVEIVFIREGKEHRTTAILIARRR